MIGGHGPAPSDARLDGGNPTDADQHRPHPQPDAATTNRRGRPRDSFEGLGPSTGVPLMARAGANETVRVTEACTACGACLATCPERALRMAPRRPLVIDAACTACWACIEICPAGAIVAAGWSPLESQKVIA